MSRGALVWAHYEARNLQVTLDFMIVLHVRVEKGQPNTMEFVVQIPIKRGQAHRVLADEHVGEHWVVVIHLKDKLKSLNLILVHQDTWEGE